MKYFESAPPELGRPGDDNKFLKSSLIHYQKSYLKISMNILDATHKITRKCFIKRIDQKHEQKIKQKLPPR